MKLTFEYLIKKIAFEVFVEYELVSHVLLMKTGPLAWWVECLPTVQETGFGLVSLFNGISTFVGYLMPKTFSKKNSSGTI